MTTNVPPTYEATRRSLHAVAEHVLAAALHRATGRIGLRATPGGFGTPAHEVDGVERRLRVEGTDLVVDEGSTSRRAPLRTVGGAAAFAGVEPGAPADVYRPATPLDPDAPLVVDPGAAAIVHHWFDLTDRALTAFREQHAAGEPSIAQLWPEHFDLALTLSEVNYGGSPGDDQHTEPYLYVGPWRLDGHEGAFWNEPFGASLPFGTVPSAGEALAFFAAGRSLTASAAATPPG
ncbi:MAG TPA: hypothetical protein VF015_09080 [Acidimicrobiales bacterium]